LTSLIPWTIRRESLFSPAGDLAVANNANNTISVYSSTQLPTGGALVPNAFVSGGKTKLNKPSGLIFGPTSTRQSILRANSRPIYSLAEWAAGSSLRPNINQLAGVFFGPKSKPIR
jgi:hypothetical protein